MPRWKDDPKGPYIRLHSGRKFHLNNPREQTYDVRDIAYHLAGINRYTGGSRMPVAQHCVVAAKMAERFYPDALLLPAKMLIHDAAEFAYGDMSSPLKALNPDYRYLLHEADLAIETRFDLAFVGQADVKEVDYRMYLTERLMVFRGADPEYMADFEEDVEGCEFEPFPLAKDELRLNFEPWDPALAEEEWLYYLRLHLPWVK